jgi:hypothetical protein
MNRRLWTGFLLPTVFVPKLAAAALPAEASLTIRMYDRARIGSKTLIQAERVASEIFSRAGIEARWIIWSDFDGDALVNDFSPGTKGCVQPLHSANITAVIVADAPGGVPQQALGYALPCARRGVQVTIYGDRVGIVSRTSPACFYRVLGHAIAHEVGHVLLRSSVHGDAGVMKAVWNNGDWQRAAITIIPFTPDQGESMVRELLRAEAPETAGLQRSGIEPASSQRTPSASNSARNGRGNSQ